MQVRAWELGLSERNGSLLGLWQWRHGLVLVDRRLRPLFRSLLRPLRRCIPQHPIASLISKVHGCRRLRIARWWPPDRSLCCFRRLDLSILGKFGDNTIGPAGRNSIHALLWSRNSESQRWLRRAPLWLWLCRSRWAQNHLWNTILSPNLRGSSASWLRGRHHRSVRKQRCVQADTNTWNPSLRVGVADCRSKSRSRIPSWIVGVPFRWNPSQRTRNLKTRKHAGPSIVWRLFHLCEPRVTPFQISISSPPNTPGQEDQSNSQQHHGNASYYNPNNLAGAQGWLRI